MSTLTRKQREIRDREGRILEVARPMLLHQGYHGLSMERIAKALDYAKGTIYNHFSCKEEVIIALAIQTMQKRMKQFQQAATFSGQSRERAVAMGVADELFVMLYPDHFQTELILHNGSIRQKTSRERQSLMRACEQRCIGIVAGVVRDAIATGDLVLPDTTTPEDLVFGLWSLDLGAFTILTTSEDLPEMGIRDPWRVLRQAQHRMLDGYGWTPLSTEHDYAQVRSRVFQEVFRDEARSLPLLA